MGLHLFQEMESPFGTVPEEVEQNPGSSQKWGAFLITWAALALGTSMLSHFYPWFASAVSPMFFVGLLILAIYAIWVVFAGRTVEFMGKPAVDDPAHDHGHH